MFETGGLPRQGAFHIRQDFPNSLHVVAVLFCLLVIALVSFAEQTQAERGLKKKSLSIASETIPITISKQEMKLFAGLRGSWINKIIIDETVRRLSYFQAIQSLDSTQTVALTFSRRTDSNRSSKTKFYLLKRTTSIGLPFYIDSLWTTPRDKKNSKVKSIRAQVGYSTSSSPFVDVVLETLGGDKTLRILDTGLNFVEPSSFLLLKKPLEHLVAEKLIVGKYTDGVSGSTWDFRKEMRAVITSKSKSIVPAGKYSVSLVNDPELFRGDLIALSSIDKSDVSPARVFEVKITIEPVGKVLLLREVRSEEAKDSLAESTSITETTIRLEEVRKK